MAHPRIYLSGRFSTSKEIETEFIAKTKNKFRCFSFANVDKRCIYFAPQVVEAYEICKKKKIGIMMDSGAHSFHKFSSASKRRGTAAEAKVAIDQEALKDQMFEWFAAFCKQDQKSWDFFFTLDYKKHQPTILAMQDRFMKEGLHPVPVFHGDVSLDWLKKYQDRGCTLIGVGTSSDFRGRGHRGAKFYYDKLFDYAAKHNLRLHGLAVTSLSMLTSYPWWSVDSSTWSKTAIYGCINLPDRNRNTILNLHVSDRKSSLVGYNDYDRKQRAEVDRIVSDLGFEIKSLRHGKEAVTNRHTFNGYVFTHLFDLVDFEHHSEKSVKWESLV